MRYIKIAALACMLASPGVATVVDSNGVVNMPKAKKLAGKVMTKGRLILKVSDRGPFAFEYKGDLFSCYHDSGGFFCVPNLR